MVNTLVRSYDYLPLVHSAAIVIKNQKEKKQKEDAQIVLVCQLQKKQLLIRSCAVDQSSKT